MSSHNVVILDGTPSGHENLTPALAILQGLLKESGADLRIFTLRDLKLAHCIGCFGCWLETPGLCRYNEAGAEILQAVIWSDTVILFTPVVFGGYSSQLKQIVDRFTALLMPYLGSYRGEMHHRPRYPRYPRWVAIGVQPEQNEEEAAIFKLLVGRNAINFHAPSYAAEVIGSTDDPEALRRALRSLLSRGDPFPWGAAVKSLAPPPDAIPSRPAADGARRALLVIGSPKTLSPSTSGVLGNHLLERLREHGWETESLTLKANLLKEGGQSGLLAAVDRADLLLFAFPLYVDTLPYLMIKALEVIRRHRQATRRHGQRLFVIVNNGFVEAYQDNLALAICCRFAAESGMTWAGGMAMGAGEAISGGEPLKPVSAQGVPCIHVPQALDAAAAALARGQVAPAEAVRGIARNPLPHAPFWAWRLMATFFANRWWVKRAAGNGVSKQGMRARPYQPA